MKKTLSYVAMAFAGGLLALSAQRFMQPEQQVDTPTAVKESEAPVRFVRSHDAMPALYAPTDFVEAAEMSVNAVVHVTTEAMVQQRDPFMEFFWGYRSPGMRPMRGAGSGVIITDDGYIVTNNHVIDGADKIEIHLNDHRKYEARVIGRDPSTDLALLKVDASGLPVLAYGNSDEVRVGEWVLAVGNPMNLTSTVTAGIVSAKARTLNLLQYNPDQDIIPIESFIQTDAAVNPGNSGGALVNTRGELVGINTAIQSSTGSYTGYSFAIPANIVKKVAGDLLEYGSVQRAFIGVTIRNVDQELAKELALGRIRGVYVDGLTEGGAARDAGVEKGDVIVRVANAEVNNVPQLQEQVSRFRPGDQVTVTVLRNGREKTLNMTLRGREGSVLASHATDRTSTLLGAELVKAEKAELDGLNLKQGVKVQRLSAGKLRSAGIREGFIITSIGQQAVKEPKDIERILSGHKGGVLVEGVYPNGVKAYYGLGL